MPRKLQIKRGLNSGRTGITPDSGELIYTLDTKRVFVGDNATPGGIGLAPLDSNSKIDTAYLPEAILGALNYQGTWSAATNTPTLPTPSTTNKGWFWITSTSGTYNTVTYRVNDWVVSNGTTYDKVDNQTLVASVFGRTGAISATAGDYTASLITNTPAGNIAATTVQAALNELDTEKVPKTTSISIGTGLTGGGDLSTSRTIAIANVGTAGTYTKVVTNAQGQVTSGTSLLATDLPSGIDAANIGSGIVDNTEFSYLNNCTSNIQAQLNGKVSSARTISTGTGLTGGGDLTTNRTFSIANIGTSGTYAKVVTNAQGQVISGGSLLASDIPSGVDAVRIGSGTVDNTEFGHLNTVSANIQTQLNAKQDTLLNPITGTGAAGRLMWWASNNIATSDTGLTTNQVSSKTVQVNIGDGTVATTSSVALNSPEENASVTRYQTGGVNRWYCGKFAGNVYTVRALDTSGATIDDPISIANAAGSAVVIGGATATKRSIQATSQAGTGRRLVEADTNGVQSATAPITAFAKTILDDATAGAVRSTIGVESPENYRNTLSLSSTVSPSWRKVSTLTVNAQFGSANILLSHANGGYQDNSLSLKEYGITTVSIKQQAPMTSAISIVRCTTNWLDKGAAATRYEIECRIEQDDASAKVVGVYVKASTVNTVVTVGLMSRNNGATFEAGGILTSAPAGTLVSSVLADPLIQSLQVNGQAGSGNRLVQTDANGLQSASIPVTDLTTLTSNLPDIENLNFTFRQNAAAGYSKMATVTLLASGHSRGVRIQCVGNIYDNRRGSFDIYFGAYTGNMAVIGNAPILIIDDNSNTTWSFGYTIDVDTALEKTYTLWANNGNAFAFLEGTVIQNTGTGVTIFKNQVPTTIPVGYTAASFVDKKLGSLVLVQKTPSSSTDTGTTGQICADSSYIYHCVSTNTWKRTALSTW